MSFTSNPLYLHKPAFSSSELKSSIEKFLESWLVRHNLQSSDELFHYTSLEGLKGILKTRSIWFSHASSLNDPLELQYGRNKIGEIITDYIEKNTDELLRAFFSQIKLHLGTLGDLIHHPFVACFCEEGDLLSQWRAYAQKGGGYSLGFKFTSTTQLAAKVDDLHNGRPLFLRKVIYNPDEQKSLVQEYFDEILPVVREQIEIYKEKENDSYPSAVFAMQACNPLLDLMLCFKHPAFHEEKEWRLLRVTRDDFDAENLKFRENNDSLIPYRAMHLFDNKNDEFEFPCTSIINGPSAGKNNKAAIELYIHHLSKNDHPIKINPHKAIFRYAGYSLR